MYTVMGIIQLAKMLGHMNLFLLSDTCHLLERRVRTATGQRELPFRLTSTASDLATTYEVALFSDGIKSWCAHPFSRPISRQAPSFPLYSALYSASSIRFWSDDPSQPEHHDLLWLVPFPADALLDVPRDFSASVQLLPYGITVAVFAIEPTDGRFRVSHKPDPHRIPIIRVGRIPSNPNLVIRRDTGQARGFREPLVKCKI